MPLSARQVNSKFLFLYRITTFHPHLRKNWILSPSRLCGLFYTLSGDARKGNLLHTNDKHIKCQLLVWYVSYWRKHPEKSLYYSNSNKKKRKKMREMSSLCLCEDFEYLQSMCHLQFIQNIRNCKWLPGSLMGADNFWGRASCGLHSMIETWSNINDRRVLVLLLIVWLCILLHTNKSYWN